MQNEANEKQLSLPLDALQRIEAVCIEYEEAAPETRNIASLLSRSDTEAERLQLLEELVALDVEFKSESGHKAGFSDYESLANTPIERARLERIFDRSTAIQSDSTKVLPGAKVGNYVIQQEIGQGGMGVVYLAKREKDFEKSVAIKVIRRDFLSDELVERFRHETQIQGKISEHPNIVSLIDAGETEAGEPFLVTEFVDGLRLDDYLDAHSLSVDERLELFQQVNAGIAFAHQNAIIHRDIKPNNILVNSEGIPKIIDFGLAKLAEGTSQRETVTVAMTPMYASPEQIRGEPATTASDIYSLGVVLYESLTGQSPYTTADSSIKDLVQSVTEEQP
ncbi:MAG: serine/threonine-protein kinase, partial [Planctomycetota bacterium]